MKGKSRNNQNNQLKMPQRETWEERHKVNQVRDKDYVERVVKTFYSDCDRDDWKGEDPYRWARLIVSKGKEMLELIDTVVELLDIHKHRYSEGLYLEQMEKYYLWKTDYHNETQVAIRKQEVGMCMVIGDFDKKRILKYLSADTKDNDYHRWLVNHFTLGYAKSCGKYDWEKRELKKNEDGTVLEVNTDDFVRFCIGYTYNMTSSQLGVMVDRIAYMDEIIKEMEDIWGCEDEEILIN